MGSGAQDERNDRFLREAEEEVAELQRQVGIKEAELKALKEKLASSKQALAQQRDIDARRY